MNTDGALLLFRPGECWYWMNLILPSPCGSFDVYVKLKRHIRRTVCTIQHCSDITFKYMLLTL